jgi:hypothetical protein
MPMLTVRLSDEEHARLKQEAGSGSVAALVKRWIAANPKQLGVTTPLDGATSRAVSVHAACDRRIALLDAEVRRLTGLLSTANPLPDPVPVTVQNSEVLPTVVPPSAAPKPSFLAAPDEDCVCGHDNHAYHLSGACGAWISVNGRRQRCPCPSFQRDLGFE